jgi:predicted acetylornithine/succinylornithine family transaminase
LPTYRRYPILVERGEGVYVFDEEGKKYLDFVGAIGVASLGHCHKEFVHSLYKQVEQLICVSNLYYTTPQIELAKRLVEAAFPGKVFFSNSGAEANEAAIKLAQRYGKKSGKSLILTMEGSFHGRTVATLAATAQGKYKEGFGPFPPCFEHFGFCNIKDVEEKIENTCAVMIELVQGEGGVNVVEPDFLEKLYSLCKEHGVLLIFDEVQTGVGRTGKFFCYQHYGITPDVLTLAKGIAGGLPMGVTIVGEHLCDLLREGSHASTFGANPLCCTAALTTLRILEEKGVLENVQRMGEYFSKKLEELVRYFPFLLSVKGKGLMLGVECSVDAEVFVKESLKRGLLVNATAGKVLRFLPPLIIEEKHVDEATCILEEVFKEFEASSIHLHS